MHTPSKLCEKALLHFQSCDEIMATLLLHALHSKTTVLFPIPKAEADYFQSIVTAIISQQISTKAATAIRLRVEAALPSITPKTLLKAPPHVLRACGVSPQKIRYITFNAQHWHALPTAQFQTMETEEIIALLTTLHGVGRWTAEMFCIFTLARTDVFSRGDLGLMQSLYHYYNFHPHYTRKINAIIAQWSPYQSVAALALWHARDTGFAAS